MGVERRPIDYVPFTEVHSRLGFNILHSLFSFYGLNYKNIKDSFKLQPLENGEWWGKRIGVSVCRASPHGACISVQQLLDNIIIAMKQRPSRNPNQILHPTDPPALHPPPLLVFNHTKQPHQLAVPSQKAPTRDSPGLARVEVSAEAVGELLEIYEWRAQTDYPILRAWWRKVSFNQIVFTQSHKQQLVAFISKNPLRNNAAIHIEVEPVQPLANYRQLPINQFLYAYREALITFERLFSLFGKYEVSSRMVGVNGEGKVKAWLHPLGHLNNKIKGRHLQAANAQASILEGVRRVLAESAQESPTFRQFFQGAQEIRSFIGLLRYIHDFSTNRRIIIASRVVKKQETPGNHPKRPLSPVAPFRPTSNYNNQRFNPHLSIAPSFLPLTGYGPQLALISRKSVKEAKEPFHLQALETTETLNPIRARVSVKEESPQKETNQYGKIVKNRLNLWLANSKSHQNLPRFSPTPSIERYLQTNSPNSIEKCMNRLFEDEAPVKFESKLMQLGRSVKESFTQ